MGIFIGQRHIEQVSTALLRASQLLTRRVDDWTRVWWKVAKSELGPVPRLEDFVEQKKIFRSDATELEFIGRSHKSVVAASCIFKGKDFFGELHFRHGGQLVREEMPNHELKIKMMDCPKTMNILILLLPLFVLNLQSVPPSPCWLTEYWEICYLHQHFYRHRSFHFQYLTPPLLFHEKHGSPQQLLPEPQIFCLISAWRPPSERRPPPQLYGILHIQASENS